jgi:hypothetical protein
MTRSRFAVALAVSFLLIGSLGFVLKGNGKPERRGEPGSAAVQPNDNGRRRDRDDDGPRGERRARTSFDFSAAPGMVEPLAPMAVFAVGVVGIDQVRQRRKRRRLRSLSTSQR